MKIIRSDKKGRNIHSPFVYRLVSNVIFAQYPYYAFSEIEKMTQDKKAENDLKIIFRLIDFFQFKNIISIGEFLFLEEVSKLVKTDINFLKTEFLPIQQHVKEDEIYNRLVIWNKCKELPELLTFPEIPEVWIIRFLNNKNQHDFCNHLVYHKNVHITIKMNHLGIVIFNKKIEKQNYVIKY